MNPFTTLSAHLRDSSRHGNHAADFLAIVSPHWAAEWSDTGTPVKRDILNKLDSLKQSRLVKEAKALVNRLAI